MNNNEIIKKYLNKTAIYFKTSDCEDEIEKHIKLIALLIPNEYMFLMESFKKTLKEYRKVFCEEIVDFVNNQKIDIK